jgi:hypothetical protein
MLKTKRVRSSARCSMMDMSLELRRVRVMSRICRWLDGAIVGDIVGDIVGSDG